MSENGTNNGFDAQPRDHGGPAFPQEDSGSIAFRPGMTLRDYFAAQFMARAQSLSEDQHGGWSYDNAAHCCYEMADSMLKARQS